MYQKSEDGVILSIPVIDSNLIQVALKMPSQTVKPDRISACDFSYSTLSPIKKLSDESL